MSQLMATLWSRHWGSRQPFAHFIVDTDNAISIVEKRSFIELYTALNSNALDLLVKASAMSNHILKLRAETAGAIKDLFAANPATFPETFFFCVFHYRLLDSKTEPACLPGNYCALDGERLHPSQLGYWH
ncbi:hypothetical protein PsorP6_016395 [Peronosclerospora sorghi]|uniref:Uncharacterized protein n=1 Tax=Peronosclerospora sorghi TaxID=230839 RepID=A0ACC0VK85_9STRA|nr:hypothetical protein PsorP6_016395 [Peronosclerospora sorghi]